MDASVVATIIIVLTIATYIWDKFPVAFVSLCSVIAMTLTGTLSFSDAFKGFGSNTFFMIAGMLILGNALFENGVTQSIAEFVFKRFAVSEKALLLAFMWVSAIFSAFLHNAAVLTMMMPIMDYYVMKSEGRFRRKIFYMPVAQFIIFGTRIALIGSASPMLANEVLMATDGCTALKFFEFAPETLIVMLILSVCYMTFLYKMEENTFDFSPEANTELIGKEDNEYVGYKKILTGIVAVLVIIGFSFVDKLSTLIPGINTGIISITAVAILVVTGAIDFKTEIKQLDVPILIIIGSATGFATCFNISGIGDKVVNWLSNFEVLSTSPALIVIIYTFVSSLLINCMANSLATATLSALGIAVAMKFGINPHAMVGAVLFGGGCSALFPTSTYTLTMAHSIGYKFSDYTKIGAVYGLICCTCSAIVLCLFYGLI